MTRILVLAIFIALQACNASARYIPQNGDIVFQVSLSSQSKAIQAATHSKYSHVGIVFIRDGQPFVYEAIGPVKETPLDTWVNRGAKAHFVAKRLRDSERQLTPDAISRLKTAGAQYKGLPYDLTFEWSDNRIYCSELVWKIYKQGLGLEIGPLQRIRDFDLTHPAVRAKMQERYGQNVPMDELVISPAAMFDSPELRTVYEQ